MNAAADLRQQRVGIEAVRRGGFGHRLESRHGAADATHAATRQQRHGRRPAGDELGHRELKPEGAGRHGGVLPLHDYSIGRALTGVVAPAQVGRGNQ